MLYLKFDGLDQLVSLCSCADEYKDIQTFFSAWPSMIVSQGSITQNTGIELSCKKNVDGNAYYSVDAPWLPLPFIDDTLACALCNLSIEMINGFCREHEMLCMHGAVVRLGAHSILLLGTNRAGKSALAVRLMAQGHQVLGDDLVGLNGDGTAFSFGIAPRLRLPLPPSTVLTDFVQRHAGCQDRHYLYLTPGTIPLAPHGSGIQLSHIILLQRHEGSKKALIPLSAQNALLRLLPRYIMQGGDAGKLLQQAGKLAARLPLLLLLYNDLDTAVDCLQEELLRHKEPADKGQHFEQMMLTTVLSSRDMQLQKRKVARIPGRRPYLQRPGVRLLRQDQKLFLISPVGNALHRLNPMGQAIWQMMEKPLSQWQAIGLLAEAFPGIEMIRIKNDIARLFQDLRQAGLIMAA